METSFLTEFIQKLVSEVEDGASVAEGDKREVSNLYPLLMQQNGGRDSWHKGNKTANANMCKIRICK